MAGPFDLCTALRRNQAVVLEALPATGLSYLLAQARDAAPFLVVTPDTDAAEAMVLDLAALGAGDVAYLPASEHVPFEDISPDKETVFARFALRHRLLHQAPPAFLVTPAAALSERWMPKADFVAATQRYSVDQEIDREALLAHLVRCGYQPVNFVEDEATFALRGGVIDMFVPGQKQPYRFDLFGDTLASIKTFAPESQRTFEALPFVEIFPVREVIYDDSSVKRATAWLHQVGETAVIPSRQLRHLREEINQRTYFYGIEALWPAFYAGTEPMLPALVTPQTRLVLLEPEAVQQVIGERTRRAQTERQRAAERHVPTVEVSAHITDWPDVAQMLQPYPRIEAVALALGRETPQAHGLADLRVLQRDMALERANTSEGEVLKPLVKYLDDQRQQHHAVYFCCSTRGRGEQLRELLLGRRRDVPLWPQFAPRTFVAGQKPHDTAAVVVAPLQASFVDTQRGVSCISDVDIFKVAQKRLTRARTRPSKQAVSTLRQLQPGDFVIHQDHGIGRYEGLVRLILSGVDGDYAHLVYADDDKLYVPVYRINVLQQYRGPTQNVRLDKLGGARWNRAKQRVKDAVLAIAHGMLALQAERRARPGFALPAPDASFGAFVSSFPYEETPDQQKAIDDVVTDLQKTSPMDRLVCGDVGYGKTEVAMRAAMLTVLGNKQVAVLVPTTVLAEQHRATFIERLQPFGVVVAVLSRFRTAKETRDILQRTQEGKVDVIVGTHRLLSHDVAFKDLGLLVVDEEQRFGVKHKERIKQLRSHVHVLTLSATPIPRTMHMATVGLRDLSLIQTPPASRSAIRTEVLRFDEAVMTEAIRRELHRGGQVFVVHNRVQSIAAMAQLVQRLVPEAGVMVAHGQMTGEALERIMVDFVTRKFNVLVCTAIIESGIDIPSANTMIVNRADSFGLSQLYQLRGRIGRGRERAYAYLMLPRTDQLSREATARLAVLKRFSELGAGFQIASHDLELRGAGDLLGADQSGSIAAVGFELYTELLQEAVERARGQKHVSTLLEPDIKLPVAAVLPEAYMPDPLHRLAFYQRLAAAQSDNVVFDILGEIGDMYGVPPAEVTALAEVMVIRRRLQHLGANQLAVGVADGVVRLGIHFVPDSPVDRDDLVRRCQIEAERYRLLPSGRLAITIAAPAPAPDDASPDKAPYGFLPLVRQALGALRVVGEKGGDAL